MSGGYEALATKAKAMFGRRVRRQDLEQIAAQRTTQEVWNVLQDMSFWREAGDHLPQEEPLTRGVLEAALHHQMRQEYLRLYAFVPQRDRKLLEFPILRGEMEHILAALRRLHASLYKEVEPLPRGYLTHSKVDVEGLRHCTTYEGLVEATRGSLYYPALHRQIAGDGSIPDYGITEALLNGVYYRHLHQLVVRQYQGHTRGVLERSLGMEVDILNLMHILRVKRYFPQEDNYLPVLLPYHYRVKPPAIHAMCAAPTWEGVLDLIGQTPYAKVFAKGDREDLSTLYTATLYRVSRRQLMLGSPSIYSAVAFLNLREIEYKAVVSAVEAAKYHLPLHPSFLDMMGS